MHEGEPKPQSQESSSELVEKVKGLESKIKGLNWHRRIAYALAMVGALGFAAERAENTANENLKDVIRLRVDDAHKAIQIMEKDDVFLTDADEKDYWLDVHRDQTKDIAEMLNDDDKSTFMHLIEAEKD